MTLPTTHIEISWTGPHTWPTPTSPLPDSPGVYLWTFPYDAGFIIYAAGITRRPLTKRFREHTRSYLNGTYTLFDVADLTRGIRTERWHGFWSKKRLPEKEAEYDLRRDELEAIAREQMATCRIFAAEFTTERRLLERLEASIMDQLYNAPKPFCDIPDRGMMLAPRWKSEAPIVIISQTSRVLHGIQAEFEI